MHPTPNSLPCRTILKQIDTLIVVHHSTRETRAPDTVQARVTAQLIANTAFTTIEAFTSSPAEKDQAVYLTLSRIQPFALMKAITLILCSL